MVFFVLIFLLSFPCLTQAEIVVLQSGQRVQGKIVDQNKESLRLDVGLQIPLTYFFNEIKQILPDPPKRKVSSKSKKKNHSSDTLKQLENQAADFIDQGHVQQGLDLMGQVLQEQPTAMRHMNYASMLFGQGVVKFKENQISIAMDLLQHAEKELILAIDGFDEDKEGVFLAQAYFLLGEIYFNAYSNQEKAAGYYLKSLSYYDNPGAKAALGKLQ